FPLRFLDYLTFQPVRAVLLHWCARPSARPREISHTRAHRRVQAEKERDMAVKSAKDRLQARSILDAMIRNRQYAPSLAPPIWKAGIGATMLAVSGGSHGPVQSKDRRLGDARPSSN